jgi:hypothetical protein
MTAFTKFNPLAFRREPGPEPAKLANPAKAHAKRDHLSSFSRFSSEAAAPPMDEFENRLAPLVVNFAEWTAEDRLAFFDECAGIAEFDGHLPRAEAEARAVACCVAEWLSKHPAQSPPECCAWCSGRQRSGASVFPFGTGLETHAWLHAECWPAWRNSREAEAVAALAATGVQK